MSKNCRKIVEKKSRTLLDGFFTFVARAGLEPTTFGL